MYADCVFEIPAYPADLSQLRENLKPDLPEDLCSLLAESDGVAFRMSIDPALDPSVGVIMISIVSSLQEIWDDTRNLRTFDSAFNDFIVFGSMPNGDYLAYHIGATTDVWIISHEDYSDRYRLAGSLFDALRTIFASVS